MPRALVLIAFLATVARAQPAMQAPLPARPAPDQHLTLGVMVIQAAGYFGSYREFSDSKFDSNGVVTNVLGVHAGYGYRPARHLELGPRVDVMYTWFKDDSYLPDALLDLRATIAAAGVFSVGGTEVRIGVDAGYVESVIATSQSTAVAGGPSAGAFVTLGQRTWAPWGWFVDIGGGVARVDSSDYRADMVWLARVSLGAQLAW